MHEIKEIVFELNLSIRRVRADLEEMEQRLEVLECIVAPLDPETDTDEQRKNDCTNAATD